MAGVSFDRALESQDVIDLLKCVHNNFPTKSTVDVLTELHMYPAINKLMKANRVNLVGGTMVEQTVILDNNGTAQARFVRPYERITPSTSDVAAKMSYPLRLLTGWWAISKDEILACRGPEALVNIRNKNKAVGQANMANLIEQRFWKCPDSSTDDVNWYGIPYYLPLISTTNAADATKEAGGHNGTTITYGDGNTTTTCVGIDASVERYKLWRSYQARWYHDSPDADFSDPEDVNRVVDMKMQLRFETPANATEWTSGQFDDYQGYTTRKMLLRMNYAARVNNDSLGADLAKFAGQVVIGGVPVRWIEALDSFVNSDGDPAHPLYLINHSYLQMTAREGDYFVEDGPKDGGPEQHRVYTTLIDVTGMPATDNRRYLGGVISAEPMT